VHWTKISPEFKRQGHRSRSPGTKIEELPSHPCWQCMVRWHVHCRRTLHSAADDSIVWPLGVTGDGSTRWLRLACGFVGSGPRGRGYAGGKISTCCLVLRNICHTLSIFHSMLFCCASFRYSVRSVRRLQPRVTSFRFLELFPMMPVDPANWSASFEGFVGCEVPLITNEHPTPCFPCYGRPTRGRDLLASSRHPCKFQQVSHLGSVTARQSSSGRQRNAEALNRGRHLCSARRPSHWALAHIK